MILEEKTSIKIEIKKNKFKQLKKTKCKKLA